MKRMCTTPESPPQNECPPPGCPPPECAASNRLSHPNSKHPNSKQPVPRNYPPCPPPENPRHPAAPIPLTSNDYLHLASALTRLEEITLTRSYQGVTVTAQTMQVSKPWPVAMIIQVHVQSPGMDWRQNFESVEEMRRGLTRVVFYDMI